MDIVFIMDIIIRQIESAILMLDSYIDVLELVSLVLDIVLAGLEWSNELQRKTYNDKIDVCIYSPPFFYIGCCLFWRIFITFINIWKSNKWNLVLMLSDHKFIALCLNILQAVIYRCNVGILLSSSRGPSLLPTYIIAALFMFLIGKIIRMLLTRNDSFYAREEQELIKRMGIGRSFYVITALTAVIMLHFLPTWNTSFSVKRELVRYIGITFTICIVVLLASFVFFNRRRQYDYSAAESALSCLIIFLILLSTGNIKRCIDTDTMMHNVDALGYF